MLGIGIKTPGQKTSREHQFDIAMQFAEAIGSRLPKADS
jgi:hypothetical protein